MGKGAFILQIVLESVDRWQEYARKKDGAQTVYNCHVGPVISFASTRGVCLPCFSALYIALKFPGVHPGCER